VNVRQSDFFVLESGVLVCVCVAFNSVSQTGNTTMITHFFVEY
jgi:hypothetical protein